MKTTHTPGPWFAGGTTGLRHAIMDKNLNTLAKVNGGHELEMQANAHLIAAAPEMLEALIIMEMHLESQLSGGMRVLQPGEHGAFSAMLKVVQKAIAKARGES